jgi:hypothetical protein
MSIQFRKRLKIFPGVWLNISKSGWSLSFGGRGFSCNVGPKGHQESIGIPKTGIRFRTKRRPL